MTQVTQPWPSTVMGHLIMMIVMHFDKSTEHIILECIGTTLWWWWHVTTAFECGSGCHHHFLKCNLKIFSENCCHHWPFPGIIVHKNQFALGICPGPTKGAYSTPSDFRGDVDGARCTLPRLCCPSPRTLPPLSALGILSRSPVGLVCPLPMKPLLVVKLCTCLDVWQNEMLQWPHSHGSSEKYFLSETCWWLLTFSFFFLSHVCRRSDAEARVLQY